MMVYEGWCQPRPWRTNAVQPLLRFCLANYPFKLEQLDFIVCQGVFDVADGYHCFAPTPCLFARPLNRCQGFTAPKGCHHHLPLSTGFIDSGMVDEVLAVGVGFVCAPVNVLAAPADPVAAVFTGVGCFSDCVADGADATVFIRPSNLTHCFAPNPCLTRP